MIYFAYGSNLCLGRLRSRTPSASLLFTAKLIGYSLRFHKKSKKDNSGKANAYRTNVNTDIVWGAVFAIDDKEKPALDQAEGLDKGYVLTNIQVIKEDQSVHNVCTYVAHIGSIDDNLKPYSWYKRFIVDGARQLHLPQDYILQIEAIIEIDDPDKKRAAVNLAIQC